jgi:NADH dehydrogenase (ubiquinone) 1 alpha subcomplex subunit 6
VPWAVKNYRLDELTTPAELRSHVAALFRARGGAAAAASRPGGGAIDPRVVDLLIYKGREELESVVLQHKQRHHLIGEYITAPRAARAAARAGEAAAGAADSAFLRAFYANTA